MLELHIWPPAYSLPSITSECIAAVALLDQLLEPNAWRLIADHDPRGKSPSGDFPALRDDATGTWTGGFVPMVRYLSDEHGVSLDADLTPRERSTSTSYVRPATTPTQNTNEKTTQHKIPPTSARAPAPLRAPARRPLEPHSPHAPHILLADPQPPPLAHEPAPPNRAHGAHTPTRSHILLPRRRRRYSKRRRGHIRHAHPPRHEPGGTPLHNLLHKRRTLLRRELQHTAARERMRISTAVDDLCRPLNALLTSDSTDTREGTRTSLVREQGAPTSAEVLLLGYFSLLMYAPAPRAWVSEGIRERWGGVARYVDRLRDVLVPRVRGGGWRGG